MASGSDPELDKTSGIVSDVSAATTVEGESCCSQQAHKEVFHASDKCSISTANTPEEAQKNSGVNLEGPVDDAKQEEVEEKETQDKVAKEGGHSPDNYDDSGQSSRHSSLSQPSHQEWSISFEQFLANIANEERLVSFFEKPVDLAQEVQKLRKRQALSTNGMIGSLASSPL